MRISKLHLLVCAAALGAGAVTALADDNPAQAAARAALEEKLRQLNAQSTNAQTPAPEQSAPITVTPSGATAQEPTNPPPATTTMPSTEPQTQPMKPASQTSSPGQGLFGPVPPPSGSTPGNMQQPPATQAQPPQQPAMTQPQQPAFTQPQQPAFAQPTPNTNYPGYRMGMAPITAPPPPITPDQQAQLQALLQKYEANAITPEQYQAERAKILAEH